MQIEERCRHCNQSYQTSWPEGYQEFCCLGCRVDFWEKTEQDYATEKELRRDAGS